MRLWRREPLHERLAREGGLESATRPVDTSPWWGEVGIHGVPRPREWDAVTVVEANVSGDEARFAALADGTLVVDAGEGDLPALAAAVEGSIGPPYRAEAIRRDDGTWAVAARRISVVELPGQTGEEIDVTIGPDGRRVVVDGISQFGSLPLLEALVEGEGHVTAKRLDGDLWEAQATRL